MAGKKDDLTKDIEASLHEIEKTVRTRAPRSSPAAKAARTAAPRSHAKGSALRVRLVRSGICTPADQKATLRGLGLSRLRQEVVRGDTPAVRGMIHKVRHLVEVRAAE
jgi:large subunit ribosomal protein L30